MLLDEEDPHAAVRGVADGAQQPRDDQRRQPERELVGQQQARAATQRPGQGQHLLLTAGQQPHPGLAERLKLREQLECERRVAPADPQVLIDVQAHEHRPFLGDKTEARACAAVQRSLRHLPADPDLPA